MRHIPLLVFSKFHLVDINRDWNSRSIGLQTEPSSLDVLYVVYFIKYLNNSREKLMGSLFEFLFENCKENLMDKHLNVKFIG